MRGHIDLPENTTALGAAALAPLHTHCGSTRHSFTRSQPAAHQSRLEITLIGAPEVRAGTEYDRTVESYQC